MVDFKVIEDAIKDFVGTIQGNMQEKLNEIADIKASMSEDNAILDKLGKALNGAGAVVQSVVGENDKIIELVATKDLSEVGDFFLDNEEEEVVEEEENEND